MRATGPDGHRTKVRSARSAHERGGSHGVDQAPDAARLRK
jgi:hypothetical protein